MERIARLNALTKPRMSQRDLGELLNLPQTSVGKRLRGDIPWRLDEVKRIADHLGCTIDELIASDATFQSAEPVGGESR